MIFLFNMHGTTLFLSHGESSRIMHMRHIIVTSAIDTRGVQRFVLMFRVSVCGVRGEAPQEQNQLDKSIK